MRSPESARVGVFQHVAGYDGTTARLYVDGAEVDSFSASGAIPPGPGPLLMGNEDNERRFTGAIVNRFDLRNLANGDAGEGRFVFAFESSGFPLQATLIFEYKLPAADESEVLDWASSFHGLGALSFGEAYNAALQVITERFVARGARPGHPNGSAINAVRTNEITFGNNGIWEMREFRLSPISGLLEPAPVELTPDGNFDSSTTLASYINANETAIVAETHTVPAVFEGQSFLGGAVFNDLSAWFAFGVNNEARHHFSLNTCNGCHSIQETGVGFLQISPRFPGSEASLSGFLTGTTIPDPVTGISRTFNDLDAAISISSQSCVLTQPRARSRRRCATASAAFTDHDCRHGLATESLASGPT